MADKEEKKQVVIEDEGEEADKEKWVTHYSSNHQILLVGEGDFSFSLSLAVSFGSASNIVASSLDTYDSLLKKYKEAKSNLENLKKLGASTLHGVDATKMKLHPDLKMRKFDRIIFNFPHAGFHGKEDNVILIEKHRNLVRGFFRNANGLLRANGEIHVNHKTTAPFCHWNIEDLARLNFLALFELVDFKIEDYPGYNHKRGDGNRCDEPFPLGECSTFKFRFSHVAKKMSKAKSHSGFTLRRPAQLPGNPIPLQCRPTSFSQEHPRTSFTMNANSIPVRMQLPLTTNIREDNVHGRYFNPAFQLLGRTVNHVDYSYDDSWRCDFKMYVSEGPERTLEGDLYVLRGHHHLSNLRSAMWRRLVLTYGQHPEGTRCV